MFDDPNYSEKVGRMFLKNYKGFNSFIMKPIERQLGPIG